VEEAERILAARTLGPEQLDAWRQQGITHVATRTGARLDRVLRTQPAAFRAVWEGEELTLFALR